MTFPGLLDIFYLHHVLVLMYKRVEDIKLIKQGGWRIFLELPDGSGKYIYFNMNSYDKKSIRVNVN